MTSPQPTNCLESILFQVYERTMSDSERIQILERALAIMVKSLASDAEVQETLIAMAKEQAMWTILPKVDTEQA